MGYEKKFEACSEGLKTGAIGLSNGEGHSGLGLNANGVSVLF